MRVEADLGPTLADALVKLDPSHATGRLGKWFVHLGRFYFEHAGGIVSVPKEEFLQEPGHEPFPDSVS